MRSKGPSKVGGNGCRVGSNPTRRLMIDPNENLEAEPYTIDFERSADFTIKRGNPVILALILAKQAYPVKGEDGSNAMMPWETEGTLVRFPEEVE